MIYQITRNNDSNDNLSRIFIDSDYDEKDIFSLISAYQFLTEELFASRDAKLSLGCLEKILCEHYEIGSAYSEVQKYIPFNEKDGWFENDGFYIDEPDVFVWFVDFDQAVNECRDIDCHKLIEKKLPRNPEVKEEIKQLILREGLEK